ncbi:MAG: hypothetical protein QOI63_1946 [Thermoplasmata archaeon]|nr:hypothetical protein [Thermoplasmata archaeon]
MQGRAVTNVAHVLDDGFVIGAMVVDQATMALGYTRAMNEGLETRQVALDFVKDPKCLLFL